MQIKLKKIKFDERLQNRVSINQDAVSDYAQAIDAGISLPDVTVFFDGSDYWLADGFHRYHAHDKLGILEINADVINGTLREAILFSVGVNAAHGLRRTNEDKRKAVLTLLNDEEWGALTDREISRLAHVSVSFVGAVRRPEVKERQQANRISSSTKKVNECSPTTPINDHLEEAEQKIKELSYEINSISEENDKLRDAIAAGQLPDAVEIQTAEEIIIDLRKQVKNLQIELQAVKESRDKCKQEIISLKSQCARQAKQLKSLGVANNA